MKPREVFNKKQAEELEKQLERMNARASAARGDIPEGEIIPVHVFTYCYRCKIATEARAGGTCWKCGKEKRREYRAGS